MQNPAILCGIKNPTSMELSAGKCKKRSIDMPKIKIVGIFLLIAMLAALPVGKALAESGTTTLGTGTIVHIAMVTDGGVTTVMVDLLDSNGQAQTVAISLETAIKKGLVVPNGELEGTEATLTDKDLNEVTGLISDLALDSVDTPTSVTVTLYPLVDVVIDYETAQGFEPAFVDVDPDTGVMTAVDPTLFGSAVTLVDIDTVETTGLVYSITVDDPTNAESTVTVRLLVDDPKEFTFSLEEAVTHGFLVVDTTMIGTEIVIDSGDILDSATFGKAISKLGSFFAAANLVGVDFTTLQEYKDDGYGYGVISQALWMAANIGGDEATFAMIMEAKRTGNFSLLSDTATNWGQYRNEILTSGKQNLGQIMSGKAVLPTTEETTTTTTENTKKNNGQSTDKGNNGNSNADSHRKNNKP
jgi:hypothetical protein